MERQTLPNSTLVLVMGILSIVGCCCYGLPGLICGIVAVVVGQKATSLYKEAPENYSGFDNVKAGKIMGIIGIVLSVLFIIYLIWVISFIGWEVLQDPDQLRERMEEMQRNG
ncbi:MAG: DUF4190 domain-containing protein [Bacteroidia bacterium]|nr:DUF4190 domain-containing protein [Bacteroidia bacterium]MBT8269299.1 DUF4190 domain-containing protein [Bacteroidia bacterium]NNK69763.1 DUF4190 domain-containing protein [Flavobacteriaceae bacterium]NNL80193.1 DUF4190 domain-containing protein [Flavobacteriaceae bacterium]